MRTDDDQIRQRLRAGYVLEVKSSEDAQRILELITHHFPDVRVLYRTVDSQPLWIMRGKPVETGPVWRRIQLQIYHRPTWAGATSSPLSLGTSFHQVVTGDARKLLIILVNKMTRLREPFANLKRTQRDILRDINELTRLYTENELELGQSQDIVRCIICKTTIPYRRGRRAHFCQTCHSQRATERTRNWRAKNPLKYRNELRVQKLRRDAWKRRGQTALARVAERVY